MDSEMSFEVVSSKCTDPLLKMPAKQVQLRFLELTTLVHK